MAGRHSRLQILLQNKSPSPFCRARRRKKKKQSKVVETWKKPHHHLADNGLRILGASCGHVFVAKPEREQSLSWVEVSDPLVCTIIIIIFLFYSIEIQTLKNIYTDRYKDIVEDDSGILIQMNYYVRIHQRQPWIYKIRISRIHEKVMESIKKIERIQSFINMKDYVKRPQDDA